jgi:hypothetical protein
MDSFVSTNDMSSYFASSELDVHGSSTPAIDVLVDSQYESTQFNTYCIIA